MINSSSIDEMREALYNADMTGMYGILVVNLACLELFVKFKEKIRIQLGPDELKRARSLLIPKDYWCLKDAITRRDNFYAYSDFLIQNLV